MCDITSSNTLITANILTFHDKCSVSYIKSSNITFFGKMILNNLNNLFWKRLLLGQMFRFILFYIYI